MARLSLLLLVLLLAGCGREDTATPRPSATSPPSSADAGGSVEPLPTLYPTATRPAAAAATQANASATPAPATTVDFDQPVVEFRYRIPALGLDRRLEGNVSGQITVVDETTGVAAIRPNQSNILLELQAALPNLELEAVPEDCDECILFSYAIPLEGVRDEGWLQDPIMLASVDNYTSIMVGPHFPPGTVAGLRRAATPFDVAQTVVMSDDGLLYRWLATDAQVAPAETVADVAPDLPPLLEALDGVDLGDSYVVECAGVGPETLYLALPDAEAMTVAIRCPAFTLPSTLLPLYLRFDALLAEIASEVSLDRPPYAIPLGTLVDYQRDDGARLTLLLGGEVRAISAVGDVFTDTLPAGEVFDLAAALAATEALQHGVEGFRTRSEANVVLVRTTSGVAEAVWEDEPPSPLEDAVAELDAQLESMLAVNGALAPTVTVTPLPADDGGATATVAVTPAGPTAIPTLTATLPPEQTAEP